MGAESSKGKVTADNSLLNDVTSEDLKNLQDFQPETNINEVEVVNLTLDENATKAEDVSKNSIVVNDTNLGSKNADQAEDKTGVEEERVIEIDEYTRKLTIIQENVYHYVGLVSGSEYAREMGIEVKKSNIPQAPIEFLFQRKAKPKTSSLSYNQPEQMAFENESPDIKIRSLEQLDDEKSIANDSKATISCEEKLIKGDDSGISAKNTADKITVGSQILGEETSTESIASTAKSNGDYSGEAEDNGEKDKASKSESIKNTNKNGGELMSEGSKLVSKDSGLDEAEDVTHLDSFCQSLSSDRKPREGRSELEENRGAQILDNLAILSEPSGESKNETNACASKCNEQPELSSQGRVTGMDVTRSKEPNDKRKTTLPILKPSIPGASERKKSSLKSVDSTAVADGSQSKITKSIGRDDKQKNTSIGFDDNNKKSDLYETEHKVSSGDILQQDDVMQVSSRSSDEAILISVSESDRNAENRLTVETGNTLNSNEEDFESCPTPLENKRSTLSISKGSENRKEPGTEMASNDYSLDKNYPISAQDTSNSTSTNQEDDKGHFEKPVNDGNMTNKLNVDEANSKVNEINESPLESEITKTINTETQMTFPTSSIDYSNDNEPAETKDKNPDVRDISQDHLTEQRPHPKSVGRTVSINDNVSLISGDDDNAAVAKRKTLARSRSVGFRDPEVIIPDKVRPTKTRVPLASASVRDPLKPTSADGKTKIPLTNRKSPQVTPIKMASLQENKSPLTPKENPNKIPSRPAARPALIRSKTLQEPATRRRSATTNPQAASSVDHSRAWNQSALKTASMSKVTHKKADNDATLKKPSSKSMESTHRCSCRQKSGVSLARSLSTTDAVKHEASSDQKLCNSLSHRSHDDNKPVG